MDADDGGKQALRSLRETDIQQIFRVVPITQILAADHILRIHHTGIPLGVPFRPFQPQLSDGFFHSLLLLIPFRTGHGV